MKLVRYVCTHCGKKFEAEEKEILECPGCFWSTSVKREEEAAAPASAENRPAKPAFKFQMPALPKIPWQPILGIAIVCGILFVAMKGIAPFIKRAAEKSPKIEKNETPAAVVPQVPAAAAQLPAESQNILARRIQVSADRVPSEEELKVLSARASFKTGFAEKLPSQAWTLENFKEMIKQQEQFYKVPLPRSYKGKLEDLFKSSYLTAAEAFKNGDLITARNGWIDSLAFPVYANDPRKHKGVILTMTKPFITDTLSKIGTINSILAEKTVRDREQEAAATYQKFVSFIDQKNWPEALKAAEDLNAELNSFSNPKPVEAPPYPASISKIDSDIQASIQELSNVPPPAVSDLEPMQQDILLKRGVIESFIPEKLKEKQEAYDAAIDHLQRGEWEEAKKKLRTISTPLEMRRDAVEKIQILEKMQNPPLNPSEKAANLNPGSADETNRQPAE